MSVHRLPVTATATPPTNESPSRDDLLREMILTRDQIAINLTRIDLLIAEEARIWADARGITVRPTIAQLRREVGL